MKRIIIALAAIALLFGLTACAPDPLAQPSGNIDHGSFATGVNQSAAQAGEWDSGFIVSVPADNTPVGLLLAGTATRGEISLLVRAEDGTAAWQSVPVGGVVNIQETLTNLPAGEYRLFVAWDEAVTATFDLYMVPGEAVSVPAVKPAALLGGGGMLLVALAFLAYAGIKRLGWRYIGLGALAWVVTVAVKFLIAIPLNPVVYKLLVNPEAPGLGDWVMYLYIGVLTGVTEILMVWVLLRLTRLKKATWEQALGFGIGFGAFEALLLGFSSFGSVLAALLAPGQIPANAMTALAVGNHPLVGLAPIMERFFTVWVHVLSNVLLFYGAAKGQNRYFWIAFWLKSGLDTAAAYAQLTGVDSLATMWAIEAIVAVFGLLSIWGVQKIKALFPRPIA